MCFFVVVNLCQFYRFNIKILYFHCNIKFLIIFEILKIVILILVIFICIIIIYICNFYVFLVVTEVELLVISFFFLCKYVILWGFIIYYGNIWFLFSFNKYFFCIEDFLRYADYMVFYSV